MLAINHALTGAAVGLTISNPLLAAPVAFVSHFVLDSVPHYDPPGSEVERISTERFIKQLIIDTSLCLLLVCILALTRPKDWLLACVCAFLAASPDLFWIPKFLRARKNITSSKNNVFLRFHSHVQWYTSSKLWAIEALYFITLVSILTFLVMA